MSDLWSQHAEELRHTWQARLLGLAQGRMLVALTSMLAHSFAEAMPVLLRLVEPPCWDSARASIKPPFLTSVAKINKSGGIVADAILRDYDLPCRDVVMFSDVRDLEYACRKLADRACLIDRDRREFFKVAQRWVASDRRLDPAMDPRDPEAKRLVH